MEGKIIKAIAGFYYIHTEQGRVYACRARGIFRKDGLKPLVGDNAAFSVLDEEKGEGSLDAVLPRKNVLIRPAVANVDQALLVFALRDPEPNLNLLDRFLVYIRCGTKGTVGTIGTFLTAGTKRTAETKRTMGTKCQF